MNIEQQRRQEHDKYRQAYTWDWYKQGDERRDIITRVLTDLPLRGTLLDVGTGRGETLQIAEARGYQPQGTEVVDALLNERVTYAEVHALPFADGAFDVVTCLDVLEHLVPTDTQAALAELGRVAGRVLILSIGAFPHTHNGIDLHPNRRTPGGWQFMVRSAYGERAELIREGSTQWWIVTKESP